MSTRNDHYIWDVFICHASEDKESVALPLAEGLQKVGLKVWIDQQEIYLGDSLRRKIDEGLGKSRYGIVILSKFFFAKEWPQKELDALVAREDGKDKVILPIWHNLTKDEVARYSPLLAGKIAANTSQGIDAIVNQVVQVMNSNEPTDRDKAS